MKKKRLEKKSTFSIKRKRSICNIEIKKESLIKFSWDIYTDCKKKFWKTWQFWKKWKITNLKKKVLITVF